MKNFLRCSASILLIFASCEKENRTEPTQVQTPSPANTIYYDSIYTRLNTGNYWVYELHRIDSGITDMFLSTDTCYVSGDSMINGNSYKVVINFIPHNLPNTTCLRDSSGFLIDANGTIYYKENLTNDTLSIFNWPSLFNSYSLIYHASGPVVVPSGTFNDVVTIRTDIDLLPPSDTTNNPIHGFIHFARGVGKLQDCYQYQSTPWTQYVRKLSAYHVL
jgi:hypothetical protein